MKFKDLEKILQNDGWYKCKVTGGHHQYKNETKTGKITIPRHCKEIDKNMVYSILKQAQINKNKL